MFEKILNLLPSNNELESKVGLIDGTFGNNQDELETSKIVKFCQNNLTPKSVLVQGDHIDSKPVNIFNISEPLIESVEKALHESDS